jgi:sec-independent protein translocase protein TatC
MAPAFEPANRRMLAWGVVAILALFYMGTAFGWMLLGRMVGFLSGFATDTLKPMVTTDAYFGFVLALVGGCGLIFQTPVVVGLLVRLGLLSSSGLRAGWRQAALGSLVLAAFITPSPDAVTQIMLAGPIFGLYLLSIGLASFIEKREIAAAMESN